MEIFQIGQALEESGHLQQALAILEDGMKVDRMNFVIQYRRANILFKLQKFNVSVVCSIATNDKKNI